MLAEANNLRFSNEELEQVAHLESLAKVVVLVHVERLQVLAASEDEGVILVLWLTLAHNRVARQPHLVQDAVVASFAVIGARQRPEQHAGEAGLTVPAGGRLLRRQLDVGNTKALREVLAQLVDMLGLLIVTRLLARLGGGAAVSARRDSCTPLALHRAHL